MRTIESRWCSTGSSPLAACGFDGSATWPTTWRSNGEAVSCGDAAARVATGRPTIGFTADEAEGPAEPDGARPDEASVWTSARRGVRWESGRPEDEAEERRETGVGASATTKSSGSSAGLASGAGGAVCSSGAREESRAATAEARPREAGEVAREDDEERLRGAAEALRDASASSFVVEAARRDLSSTPSAVEMARASSPLPPLPPLPPLQPLPPLRPSPSPADAAAPRRSLAAGGFVSRFGWSDAEPCSPRASPSRTTRGCRAALSPGTGRPCDGGAALARRGSAGAAKSALERARVEVEAVAPDPRECSARSRVPPCPVPRARVSPVLLLPLRPTAPPLLLSPPRPAASPCSSSFPDAIASEAGEVDSSVVARLARPPSSTALPKGTSRSARSPDGSGCPRRSSVAEDASRTSESSESMHSPLGRPEMRGLRYVEPPSSVPAVKDVVRASPLGSDSRSLERSGSSPHGSSISRGGTGAPETGGESA